MKLILAASAALALYLGWRSWGWPLIHDAPLLLMGAIIVAVVLAMPRGILGVLQMRYNLPRTI